MSQCFNNSLAIALMDIYLTVILWANNRKISTQQYYCWQRPFNFSILLQIKFDQIALA